MECDEAAPQISPHANEEYAVGWVSTLPIELAAAKGMLDEEHGEPQSPQRRTDQNTYLLGRIGKFLVVVACLPKHEIGSSSAAIVARDMLHTFPNIRFGLLVGTGAGIPNYEGDDLHDVRLGDVVIASDKENGGVVHYDFGKRLADGSFHTISALDRPPRHLRTAISKLEAVHEMRENKITFYINQMLTKYPYMKERGYTHPGPAADRLFRKDYAHVPGRSCAQCDGRQQVDRQPERVDAEPVIHYGAIATGGAVVKHAPSRDDIRQLHRVICLDMEAAGLMNHFPCAVIRGISNYADSHKNDVWQPYAAATAAAYAKELLEYLPAQELIGERPIKDVLGPALTKVGEVLQQVRAQLSKIENDNILDWLTPIDYGSQQSDFLARRQQGTGNWLLQSDTFQEWLRQTGQTLFCPAIPGAGKTILTSIVVDDLLLRYHDDTSVGIAYIYCNFRRTDEQKAEDLLASLVKQMSQRQPCLPDEVKNLYEKLHPNRKRSSFDDLSKLLRTLTAKNQRTFFIVDALDECQSSNGCRSRFLSEIFDLRKNFGVNLFVTSRFVPEIEERFAECVSIEVIASDNDIRQYLDGHMSDLPAIVLERAGLREKIKRTITDAVEGMFLLAELFLQSLQGKTTARQMKTALEDIQKRKGGATSQDSKLEILSEAYKQAMERMNDQRPGFRRLASEVLSWISHARRLAREVLSWVSHARRPLLVSELQHALAVNMGDAWLDQDNKPELDDIDAEGAALAPRHRVFSYIRPATTLPDMLSVFAGLVTVDTEIGIIRLIHYTTQEFFERTREH